MVEFYGKLVGKYTGLVPWMLWKCIQRYILGCSPPTKESSGYGELVCRYNSPIDPLLAIKWRGRSASGQLMSISGVVALSMMARLKNSHQQLMLREEG